MNLEFKIYELKEDSKHYQRIMQGKDKTNEFIIVGEELVGGEIDCYKIKQLGEKGLVLIGGLLIDEAAYLVEKNDLRLRDDGFGYDITVIDIPKKYLAMDTIESIQRLNE